MKMAINFFKRYLFEVKIALVTAAAVILFEVINLFVLYGYMRMDFYVSLAAVCFLAIGMLMGRKKQAATNHAPNVTQVPELLTAREKQILSLIMQGKTNKEIAAVNFIEISTVKTHLNNIYAKLAVTNRKEACAKYAQMPKNR